MRHSRLRGPLVSLLPIALLSLSLAACDDDPVPTLPTGGTSTTLPEGCSSDFSCAEGQVCVDSACMPGECNLDRTCPSGETCDRGSFTCSGSTTQACASDAECPGTFCVQGTCQDVECAQDAHCATGQRCDQNRCVTIASCTDIDRDGYGSNCSLGPDCDDGNAQINPGVIENGESLCDDGIDHNCDGVDAQCGAEDLDGDGFAVKDGDCDDNNPNVNPSQAEVYYNSLDDDCNPMTNDADRDGDGFAAEQVGGPDCDDNNPNVSPIAMDIPGNMVDEDCDGMDRVISMDDADGDGVSEAEGDCNDNNAQISPNLPEVPYNSVDDDCNASTRDNDLDGDGFGIPRDCNDDDPAINPNATEVYYNGVDEDCDPNTLDADADGDGVNSVDFGGADCNDELATVNPNATEEPYNGVDDDCNPNTLDDDLDGDGVPRSEDCNDDDANVNPNVVENASTNCDDGIDHNCVGGDVTCDENVVDSDGDGVPDPQDCEPNNPAIPGPFEISNNGLNDDCDVNTPDECVDDSFDEATSNGLPNSASAVIAHTSPTNTQYALTLCPGDEDWYQLRVNAGDGIEVDLTFPHDEGDIDARLFRLNGGAVSEEAMTVVASSTSGNDNEVLYQARVTSTDTYYIKVFHYGQDRSLRQDYDMAVRIFSACIDDPTGPSGEHNDVFEESKSMPPSEAYRQICQHDQDWYTFSTSRNGRARVDVIFSHEEGDLDVTLFDSNNSRVSGASSSSSNDNELIDVQSLPAGTYHLQIRGYQGAKARYKVFKSSGNVMTGRSEDNADQAIPDATNATTPGVFETDPLTFGAVPAGAIIRSLTVRELDINHKCLNDLKVELLWDGEPIKTVWNRQGDACLDAQLDDDGAFSGACTGGVAAAQWNGRLGNDICFMDRVYGEFAGLDAQGEFSLRVTDYVNGEVGELVNLDIEVEYLLP